MLSYFFVLSFWPLSYLIFPLLPLIITTNPKLKMKLSEDITKQKLLYLDLTSLFTTENWTMKRYSTAMQDAFI